MMLIYDNYKLEHGVDMGTKITTRFTLKLCDELSGNHWQPQPRFHLCVMVEMWDT